jgi:hypothetical protein
LRLLLLQRRAEARSVTPFVRAWLAVAAILVIAGAVGISERWPTWAVVVWALVCIGWAAVAFASLAR